MAPAQQEMPTAIGRSPAFLAAMSALSLVAPLAKPVLVVGERGTGKELAAARVHYLSPRWNQPFIKLNCGGLPPSLLEAELFGHEAGAFTGAQRRRPGRFELANRGTLFLDEIANAPMTVQETILRVVEYGSFERVGGHETVHADVRLVAATNADLPALAAAGKFRADLLDRLAFDVITLPPLRERLDDIEVLAEQLALSMTKELKRELFAGFAPSAIEALRRHAWPGNVRELKNVVERAVYRSPPDQPIETIVFDPFLSPWRPAGNSSALAVPETASPAPMTPETASPAGMAFDLVEHIQTTERDLLKKALELNAHSQKRTAAYVGMTYHQLRNYLRKHHLIGK